MSLFDTNYGAMTIKQLLQTDLDVHLSTPHRWLAGDGAGGYVVYERIDDKPVIILETFNEHEAVESLLVDFTLEKDRLI